LRSARLVQGRDVVVKILGQGELTKRLMVHAQGFSKSAQQKIEQAGGKAVVVGQPPTPAEPATT
jgi:large subunit ribosomal protein L15